MDFRFGFKCIVAAAIVATATAVVTIDITADRRRDVDINGAAYPGGLQLLNLGTKNVTLHDVTIGCPGLHISGGQEVDGRLAFINVTVACNSHRCITSSMSAAVVTVDNVDVSVTVTVGTYNFFGLVAFAFRVDRMLAGSSVAITGGRLMANVTQQWNAFGVEVRSAAVGSAITLRDVTTEVHGGGSLRAFAVLQSSCDVVIDGRHFVANASDSFADAVSFDHYGGPATLTSTSMAAIAAGFDTASALFMTAVSGQVTVVGTTLTATASDSDANAVFSRWFYGALAVLTIRGCTITATGNKNLQAVHLVSHSTQSSVTISNSTLSALPGAGQSADKADALLATRIYGASTVDVSDTRLIARGRSRVAAASFTHGWAGAAFSINRSTLEATTAGGDGAFGVVFGSTTSTLVVSDCTVAARSGSEAALGVRLYKDLTGALAILRTTFAVSATKDRSAKSGGVVSTGAPLSKMDGLYLTVADSTFDGSGSVVPLLFVRLPRRWEGQSSVALTNVTMTEQFNSTERGLVSVDTDGTHRTVNVAPGSNATRCITGLVVGGAAVADNFALPGVPSTVDCTTPLIPGTPAPVPPFPFAGSASSGTKHRWWGPCCSFNIIKFDASLVDGRHSLHRRRCGPFCYCRSHRRRGLRSSSPGTAGTPSATIRG